MGVSLLHLMTFTPADVATVIVVLLIVILVVILAMLMLWELMDAQIGKK